MILSLAAGSFLFIIIFKTSKMHYDYAPPFDSL